MHNPQSEYQSRLNHWKQHLERYKFQERLFSILRLIVFIAGVIVFGLSAGGSLFSSLWLFVPAALFIFLVVKHDRVLRLRDQASLAIRYYERGLSRINDTWMDRDDPVADIEVDPNHLYAADLDLFGSKSLFQLLCTARTISGIQTLARWLLQAARKEVVRERQDAVRELCDRVILREDLAIAESAPGSGKKKQTYEGTGVEFLLQWAEQSSSGIPHAAALIGFVLTGLTLASLFAWAVFKVSALWFVIALFAQSVLSFIFRKKIHASLLGLERAGNELKLISAILARIETENFESALLQKWKVHVSAEGDLPSRRISKLSRLIEFYDWGRNPYFAIFAGILLWRTQIGLAVDAWRRTNGHLVRRWISAIGEMEAMLSLSSYSYEHPEDPFPEIVDEGPILRTEQVGHPLIPRNRCVRNDFSIGKELSVLILSGSNMSGKSTFLRTIGTNVVLALAGAPVRASSMVLSHLAIGSSIRIQDSIQSGYSKFYAEITRIKQIMDLAKGSIPVLYLLDEILHGTNSADRLIGSEAIVKGLQQRGAIGIVTTHDLALSKIVDDLGSSAANMHFEDHIEEEKIAFDYKLKPGVIQRSNAIALMRLVGLDL
ncbi:MAG TPA: DNA mismatch repair protein MutS [Acidobacteriota bacterium]|nr:DNA mismatch repair protein MutS [Acidobacteriota bacterium]